LGSLKDDAFITGLSRDQDARSEGFPGAIDGRLGINGAANNYDCTTVRGRVGVRGSIGEEWSEVGNREVRCAAELAEGGRSGGEFEEGADGGVGQGEAQNGAVEGKGELGEKGH